MVSGVKARLRQLMQAKGLSTPMVCYLDELKYLKNQQDNYMFDCDGNMFKLADEEFRLLCLDGILIQG